MKLLAFSDLHRDLDQAAKLVEMSADADVVIGAGDFASVHEGLGETIAALAAIETPTVLVPGNNETEEALREAAAGWEAADRAARRAARRSTASSSSASAPASRSRPGTGASTSTTSAAAAMLGDCPEGAVLVLHSPPQGPLRHQRAAAITSAARRCCEAIEEKRPRLAVCGHIHESWGCESQIGETPVRNLGPTGTWIEP